MKLLLIRHGATKGNLEHRYVGSTDESLHPDGRKVLEEKKLPEAEHIYVSPMLRCRETAEILWPKKEQIVVDAFRECEFGEFEYSNYKELSLNPFYQRFIDSMGMSGFPGGEDRNTFQKRCVESFEIIMKEELCREGGKSEGEIEQERSIVIVAHGGTIMALLDYYSCPHRDYYDWQVGNGEGFAARPVCMAESGLKLVDIIAIE